MTEQRRHYDSPPRPDEARWIVFVDSPDEYEAREIPLQAAYRLGRLSCIAESTDSRGEIEWKSIDSRFAPRYTKTEALQIAQRFALHVDGVQILAERERVFVGAEDGTYLTRVEVENPNDIAPDISVPGTIIFE